jgi:hypothetical protein
MMKTKHKETKQNSGRSKRKPRALTRISDSENSGKMPELMNQSMNRTAVHEAGHAVIGHFLEIPTKEVSIREIGGVAGYVISTDDGNARSYLALTRAAKVRMIENRICLAMAGTIAESMLFGEPRILPGSEADFELVDSLIEKLYNRPDQHTIREAHFMYLWERTCEDVRRFFHVIRELATILEREQQISANVQGYITEIADFYQIRDLVKIRHEIHKERGGYGILLYGVYLGILVVSFSSTNDGKEICDEITLKGEFDIVLFHMRRPQVALPQIPGMEFDFLMAFCDYLCGYVARHLANRKMIGYR